MSFSLVSISISGRGFFERRPIEPCDHFGGIGHAAPAFVRSCFTACFSLATDMMTGFSSGSAPSSMPNFRRDEAEGHVVSGPNPC